MISEGSCDTETDAKNSALHHQNEEFLNVLIEKSYFELQ